MIDKTTAGVTAEPDEVEAILHNLCGYHLTEPDPVTRYTALTRDQVIYDALVSAIKRERGLTLAEMVASGHTLTQVAELTNLGSRQRVSRLISIARAAAAAAAELLAASEAPAGSVPAPRGAVDDRPEVRLEADDLLYGLRDADPGDAGDSANSEDSAADGSGPLLEPTQVMPALAASLSPTREIPEDSPWWRRARDPGAA
jgi:hypothetical protein